VSRSALTDEGSARLAEEAKRLQASAATALRRLGAHRPPLLVACWSAAWTVRGAVTRRGGARGSAN
jgi:hypothetical protein